MGTRLFDAVGVVTVLLWIGLTAAFLYKRNIVEKPVRAKLAETEIVLQSGHTWMMLHRQNEDEIGFVHEARTPLDEGWLLEYEMLMLVELMGRKQLIETNMRATVDHTAKLQQVRATVTSFMGDFTIVGKVKNKDGKKALDLEIDIAGKKQSRSIPLKEAPRLSSSALNQIIASPSLKPGAIYEKEFFDPVGMSMNKLIYEYVGPDETNAYGKTFKTHHFRQKVMGNELDVYVNQQGEVIVQEFPLRSYGAWVPAKIGKTRAQALRRKLRKQEREQNKAAAKDTKDSNPLSNLGLDGLGFAPEATKKPLSMDSALQMLNDTINPKKQDEPTTKKTFIGYTLANSNPEMQLTLSSLRQRVRTAKPDSKTIEVLTSNTTIENADTLSPLPETKLTDEQKTQLLTLGVRIDGNAKELETLVSTESKSVQKLAEYTAEQIHKHMKAKPHAGITSASEAFKLGSGDCTEYALVLLAALRRQNIPARFVSGVLFDETNTKPQPHQWVQYHDGNTFIDLDATVKTLKPGKKHLQLFVSDKPEHPGMLFALDKLKISPLSSTPDADNPKKEQKAPPKEPTP